MINVNSEQNVVRWKDEVNRMVFEKEQATERNNRKNEKNIDNRVFNNGNKHGPTCNTKEKSGNKVNANNMIVTIAPMEIRAFILEVMY